MDRYVPPSIDDLAHVTKGGGGPTVDPAVAEASRERTAAAEGRRRSEQRALDIETLRQVVRYAVDRAREEEHGDPPPPWNNEITYDELILGIAQSLWTTLPPLQAPQ